MITLYEFSINLHVASKEQATDIEGKLVKLEDGPNKFETAIEVVEYTPKEDGLFTADKTHTHSEEFDADNCEEAMDVFTNLINTIAMPLLRWSDDELLVESPVETKPDEELVN